MKNQVLSIAQMQHLQELGLNTSDASMHYQFLPTADSIINGTDEVEKELSLFVSQPNMKHEYPTYTLQDIMQKLPPSINICMLHIYKAADLWYFVYMDSYTRTIISTQYTTLHIFKTYSSVIVKIDVIRSVVICSSTWNPNLQSFLNVFCIARHISMNYITTIYSF